MEFTGHQKFARLRKQDRAWYSHTRGQEDYTRLAETAADEGVDIKNRRQISGLSF